MKNTDYGFMQKLKFVFLDITGGKIVLFTLFALTAIVEEAGFLTSLKVFHGEISTRFINPSLKQKGIDDERAVA